MKLRTTIAALHAALLAILLAVSPVLAGSMTLLGAGKAGAAAPTLTTWDAANAAAKITVSPAVTATQTGASGGFNAVKTVASHSTGKFCLQIHVDLTSATLMLGMGNSTESLTNFPGNDNNGFGGTNAGLVWYNSANPTSSNSTFTTGDTVIECVDIGGALVWIKVVSAGTWNNNGSADPGTGVGGIALNSVALAAGPFFAMAMLTDLNSAVTITSIGSLPTGFSNW